MKPKALSLPSTVILPTTASGSVTEKSEICLSTAFLDERAWWHSMQRLESALSPKVTTLPLGRVTSLTASRFGKLAVSWQVLHIRPLPAGRAVDSLPCRKLGKPSAAWHFTQPDSTS